MRASSSHQHLEYKSRIPVNTSDPEVDFRRSGGWVGGGGTLEMGTEKGKVIHNCRENKSEKS